MGSISIAAATLPESGGESNRRPTSPESRVRNNTLPKVQGPKSERRRTEDTGWKDEDGEFQNAVTGVFSYPDP